MGEELHGQFMKEQIVYSSTDSECETTKRTQGLHHATADKIYKIDN